MPTCGLSNVQEPPKKAETVEENTQRQNDSLNSEPSKTGSLFTSAGGVIQYWTQPYVQKKVMQLFVLSVGLLTITPVLILKVLFLTMCNGPLIMFGRTTLQRESAKQEISSHASLSKSFIVCRLFMIYTGVIALYCGQKNTLQKNMPEEYAGL